MSELEDRLNSILNDPAQMDKITNLAKTLMGGEGSQPQRGPESGDQEDGLGGLAGLARSFMGDGDGGGLDPAALGKISRLIRESSGQDNEKKALLEAMKPYLSEKRRTKMDKALKIARLARIARLAMGEMGEDGDV